MRFPNEIEHVIEFDAAILLKTLSATGDDPVCPAIVQRPVHWLYKLERAASHKGFDFGGAPGEGADKERHFPFVKPPGRLGAGRIPERRITYPRGDRALRLVGYPPLADDGWVVVPRWAPS